jgi:Na+/melibiose symporter-like transporter
MIVSHDIMLTAVLLLLAWLTPLSSSLIVSPLSAVAAGNSAVRSAHTSRIISASSTRRNRHSISTHLGAATAAVGAIRGGSGGGGGEGNNDKNTAGSTSSTEEQKPLPKELLPITMGVFAQMLGEGISLSSLPLYLTALGSSPIMVGAAISCFSIAQMTFAPIAVGLSSKPNIGRSVVLRICLVGAACSSLLIAFSSNVYGVIAGRTLAGVFAACIPVAQSSVTDLLPQNQTTLGLSRVSAAAQLGIVVGPLASATFQKGFESILGIPAKRCLPAVFILNACNAMFVLALMTYIDRRNKTSSSMDSSSPLKSESPVVEDGFKSTTSVEKRSNNDTAAATPTTPTTPTTTTTTTTSSSRILQNYAQPILRTITIIVGWTAILSNSIYGLFAPRFMGFGQNQLSATYSAAAILMVATQIVFPKIVKKMGGEHRACTVGILAVATGIGGQSLIRVQPLHSILYMLNRVGASIADTSTAAMVASFSKDRDDRSKNLALLTSTRAAARIFTPLLSSKMFELSCRSTSSSSFLLGVPIISGALPFVTAACFCLSIAPLPSILRRAEGRANRRRNDSERKKIILAS